MWAKCAIEPPLIGEFSTARTTDHPQGIKNILLLPNIPFSSKAYMNGIDFLVDDFWLLVRQKSLVIKFKPLVMPSSRPPFSFHPVGFGSIDRGIVRDGF